MTTKEWVRAAALGMLLALVAATGAQAAVKVGKPSASPRTVKAGGALSVKVKVSGKKSVVIKLGKTKLGKLKVKARKASGKLKVPARTAAGSYKLAACVGKKCKTGAKIKVTRTVPAPAPAPTPAGGPIARPAPGNDQLPPGPGDPAQPGATPTPEPVPADPKDAAPKLDPGAVTSVYDATKFLFSGANPIQRGVKPGAIDDKQVAVLRGTVQDRNQQPIKGVRVSVLDHPELGMTDTRADGAFDLAVNGGGITLQFEAAGFLTAQRTLAANWQDYETLDDVVMVPVDPNVKTIDPSSDDAFQVVRGTPSVDKDGRRQATLLVPKGTTATMILPDGTTKPVSKLDIRATEFTYGDQGDEAMPGTLPANSGYTYAAEFSVDEALQNHATQVNFNQPLIDYTENFIGAPVGSAVPTGYYDRETGAWRAANNGRVIKVLDGGVDTDGDGKADTGLGMTDAERQQLAALYQPGQELWRVPITHFTPWDHNWPYGPPPGARPPKLKEFEWKDPNDPCRQQGSVIGCETQTLGEAVPVTGTGMTLNYSTDRTPGWKVGETLQIPVVGAIPPRLKGIQLTIDVAGEKLERRWCDPSFPTTGEETCKGLPPITPNITFPFRWDGLDAYDRQIQGRVTATIKVVYVYEFNYYGADDDQWQASFSQFGSDTEVFDGRMACGNVSGTMDTHFFCGVPVGQTITRAIGSWDARPTDGLGAWTLSDHHAYDPVERTLHRGDGTTIRGEALPPVVQTLAGSRTRGVGGGEGSGNFPKDGEDAAGANIDYLGDYVRSPDGNLYLYNGLNRNHIFRVSREGKIYKFAGPGLGTVQALAAMPDGSVLIGGYKDSSDTDQIWKVSPDGKQTTVIAGTTNRQAPLGDGKPGPEAHIGTIEDMVAGPDGTVYWTERYSGQGNWKGRVRKLGPDGIVTTVAGQGDKPAQDGNAAADVALGNDPKGLALGPDGSIYVALQFDKKVIKIDPAGKVTRFAGKGNGTERGTIETGRPAADSYIDSPVSVAVGLDGAVYIRSLGYDVSPSASVILKVDEDGTLQQWAGRLRGSCGSGAVDGEGATSVCMQNHSVTIGVDGDGGVTFADGRYLIRKVMPPLPGFEADGLALPSADGREVYEFDRLGRHVSTRDGLTGATLKTFEYDAAKRLVGIVNAFGQRTRIERDADGVATAIVAPGGQRTTLTMDGTYLGSVRNPAGEEYRFTYDNGLIKSFRTPEGDTTRFDYDATGRLIAHHAPDGLERTLERVETDNGYEVKVKSAAGRTTTYAMEVLPNGDRRRTVTSPSGAKTVATVRVDGVSEVVAPDGTKTTTETAPDVRWGAAVPQLAKRVVTLPSGKTLTSERSDSVTLSNPRDPFSISSLTSTVDGATWTYQDHKITVRSAEGRSTETTLDGFGRVIKQTTGSGVAPLEYGYDALGRPQVMKQGNESTTFAYDTKNRLASSTDAAGNAITYGYDDADRVTSRILPGGREYRYAYDHDGNPKTITTPRGKVHTFGRSARKQTYAPPGSPAYTRAYSTERDLESVTAPSGAVRELGYDTAGRQTSDDTRGYTYDGDEYATVTNGAQTIAYGRDGAMPKSLDFGGARYDYTLGDQLLPANEKLTVGATEISRDVAFDDDRLATQTGPFTISRSGPNGAVSKISDGKLSLTYGYDGNGRPTARTLSVGGTEKYYSKLTFANTGRAGSREERVDGGALDTLTYGYDGSGQLLTVKRGTTVLENHTYDLNGNRQDAGAVYDDQDRLTSLNGVSYEWDADGFLRKRGNDTFTWSKTGDLLSAGATSYKYDGFGRRVAAGNTTFLYGNPANAFQVTASVRDGVVTTYYYDADDRLFALERGGERYYVGSDAVGSPRVVVRAADGVVVLKVDYDAFGVEKSVSGSFELAIGYAGGLRDAGTGLVRFGMRDYDPAAGRFIARDPSFFAGSPENHYTYANNNPVTQKDPTGLICGAWSLYDVFGGGIQICHDNDWDGHWSVCSEFGLGVGGGGEVDLVSGAQDDSITEFAEVSAKLGGAGATIGGQIDLQCMNTSASAKVMVGDYQAGIDTTGAVSAGWGQNDLPTPGFRIEGKVGLKACKKF